MLSSVEKIERGWKDPTGLSVWCLGKAAGSTQGFPSGPASSMTANPTPRRPNEKLFTTYNDIDSQVLSPVADWIDR